MSSRKAKLIRWQLSTQDITVLKVHFERNRFPSKEERDRIAAELETSARRVQVWFQNRRQRERSCAAAASTSTLRANADASFDCADLNASHELEDVLPNVEPTLDTMTAITEMSMPHFPLYIPYYHPSAIHAWETFLLSRIAMYQTNGSNEEAERQALEHR